MQKTHLDRTFCSKSAIKALRPFSCRLHLRAQISIKCLSGLCKVDETPKGWYIQYIDRDPETIRRQEELARKKKQEMDDVERSAKFIEEQVRRGRDGKETEVSSSRTQILILCVLMYRRWG